VVLEHSKNNSQWSQSTNQLISEVLYITFALSRFYTILAPRVLRPNTEYHIAVTTQKTSQPTTVTVEVSGKQDGGGMFQAGQTVSVEPYTTRIVKLEVRDDYVFSRLIVIVFPYKSNEQE